MYLLPLERYLPAFNILEPWCLLPGTQRCSEYLFNEGGDPPPPGAPPAKAESAAPRGQAGREEGFPGGSDTAGLTAAQSWGASCASEAAMASAAQPTSQPLTLQLPGGRARSAWALGLAQISVSESHLGPSLAERPCTCFMTHLSLGVFSWKTRIMVLTVLTRRAVCTARAWPLEMSALGHCCCRCCPSWPVAHY